MKNRSKGKLKSDFENRFRHRRNVPQQIGKIIHQIFPNLLRNEK
jgi:hypothetical protein